MSTYPPPPGGLPPQSQILSGRAIFTEAYAVIPRGVQTEIVTSLFPGWRGARGWVLARPLSGFAETFSHILMELEPGGGADEPENDTAAAAVLFATDGELEIEVGPREYALHPGSYAYLPAGQPWAIANRGRLPARFHWIRKRYEPVAGVSKPAAFVVHESGIAAQEMPGTEGRWTTKRFVDPQDMAHDFQVNIVAFEPGAVIPFAETHVMEHGIFVLEGKAVYRLNADWVEVEAGDFLWLRAFCPQACYAGGPGPFRYLLYKDVNRLPRLSFTG